MYAGFPTQLIDWLRCREDGDVLAASSSKGISTPGRIMTGALRCRSCDRRYPIRDGILCLLDPSTLDDVSAVERAQRDIEAEEYERSLAQRPSFTAMEMRPTLGALAADRANSILELGCGTGRYTVPLSRASRALMAVDFSEASLRILARKLDADSAVGLVLADITKLAVAPGVFDRVLSTLVSNLPSREHRLAMFKVACEGLTSDGRFVFSTHFHSLRNKLAGVAQSARYTEGGIYRYHFTPAEIDREASPYFRRVTVRPMQIYIPLGERLGLPMAATSRAAEFVPLLNQLGRLLLVACRRPIYAPAEGPASSDTESFRELMRRHRGRATRLRDASAPTVHGATLPTKRLQP
jgi:SAM-dependent methyltransferase